LSITFFMSWGEELALLDVHRLAALGHGADEIGLAAQEGRRLQHIDHGGHGGHLGLGVHVGQHRHAQLRRTLARISRPAFHARAAELVPEERLALSKLLLKMNGDAQRRR
jgi:hypothetical protein